MEKITQKQSSYRSLTTITKIDSGVTDESAQLEELGEIMEELQLKSSQL